MRRTPAPRWLLAGLFLSIATGAAVVIQDATSSRVWETSVWTGSGPEHSTGEDLFALVDTLKEQQAPPAGFELADWKGDCTGTLTGVSLPSGEFGFIVTAVDDLTDMETLNVSVDGVLEFTGTRLNGGIVDRGNFAVGTASLMLAPGFPIEIEVEWLAADGESVRHTFSAQP